MSDLGGDIGVVVECSNQSTETSTIVELGSGVGYASRADSDVALNAGSGCCDYTAKYRSNALLARGPWRLSNSFVNLGSSVSLSTNPAFTVYVLKVFDGIPFTEYSPWLDVLRNLKVAAPESLSSPILRFIIGELDKVVNIKGLLEFRGASTHHPGLHSCTYSFRYNSFLGLHVDDGCELSISELQLARNRVSINIGTNDRYFVFVDKSVTKMCNELGNISPSELFSFRPGLSDALARRFLLSGHNSAVVRVRVRPGEAYIAPTEHIVHDGSSVGLPGPTTHVTLLGHFSPKPSPSTPTL